MSKETSLNNYTNATRAIEDHIAQHPEVFEAHKKLLMAQIDAENALRDDVAEAKEGIDNGLFKATYRPFTQTIYDEEKILTRLGITREQAVEEGIITDNERPPQITVSAVRV